MYVCRYTDMHTPRPCFMFVCILKIHLVSSERKSSSIRRLISIMQDAGRDAMYLICFAWSCLMVCVTYTLSNYPSPTATHTRLPSLSSLRSRLSLSSFHFSSVLLSNNTILLPLSLSAILPSLLPSWLFSYSIPPFSYLLLCSASNTALQILDSLIKMH